MSASDTTARIWEPTSGAAQPMQPTGIGTAAPVAGKVRAEAFHEQRGAMKRGFIAPALRVPQHPRWPHWRQYAAIANQVHPGCGTQHPRRWLRGRRPEFESCVAVPVPCHQSGSRSWMVGHLHGEAPASLRRQSGTKRATLRPACGPGRRWPPDRQARDQRSGDDRMIRCRRFSSRGGRGTAANGRVAPPHGRTLRASPEPRHLRRSWRHRGRLAAAGLQSPISSLVRESCRLDRVSWGVVSRFPPGGPISPRARLSQGGRQSLAERAWALCRRTCAFRRAAALQASQGWGRAQGGKSESNVCGSGEVALSRCSNLHDLQK